MSQSYPLESAIPTPRQEYILRIRYPLESAIPTPRQEYILRIRYPGQVRFDRISLANNLMCATRDTNDLSSKNVAILHSRIAFTLDVNTLVSKLQTLQSQADAGAILGRRQNRTNKMLNIGKIEKVLRIKCSQNLILRT